MSEQLIADLKATKERVQKGWCPTGTMDNDNNVCVMIAAREMIGTEMSRYERVDRYKAVADALYAHLPVKLPSDGMASHAIFVGAYNDAPSTQQADIENLIDKALADLGGL